VCLVFLSIIWGSYAFLISKTLIIEWGIFTGGGLNLTITFLLDYIRLVFVGVVMFISSIVLLYRGDYMLSDRAFYRFIILIVLFVVSMLLIVLRPNIIRILLGWDGLGLVSYCLIIFLSKWKVLRIRYIDNFIQSSWRYCNSVSN